MNKTKTVLVFIFLISICQHDIQAQNRIIPIAKGWSRNSVNAVVFRRNSVVTHGKDQYVAFYDANSVVVLAKRKLASDKWEVHETQYKGNTRDAHNSISIMVDGDGYLHMAWDHHNDPLRYCRSVTPSSLQLTDKMWMTGIKEKRVTYPEFYSLPDGNLIFLYRDGASGRGNLMMNHYHTKTKTWTQLHDVLIDGEVERNAYWQMTIDSKGTIHLSWVWRESGDVATNHDILYAKSNDTGKTWQKSTGEKYQLPITEHNAEYACRIPQKSELINQTSMYADSKGQPYIATYWRPKGTEVPQYHLVYHDGALWQTLKVSNRKTPFTLKGGGTKRIPISRPHIVVDARGDTEKAYFIFRDAERNNRVSVAVCNDLQKKKWSFKDLTTQSVGLWEPSYDTELWRHSKLLHIYLQTVDQGDGEKIQDIPPQQVSILEWKPD